MWRTMLCTCLWIIIFRYLLSPELSLFLLCFPVHLLLSPSPYLPVPMCLVPAFGSSFESDLVNQCIAAILSNSHVNCPLLSSFH